MKTYFYEVDFGNLSRQQFLWSLPTQKKLMILGSSGSIILIDKEKTFNKIKQSFMINKYLSKPPIEENPFSLVKS